MKQQEYQRVSDRVEAYLKAVSVAKANHPEWRQGQAYFNVMRDVDPELADQVTGTVRDPFYIDGRLSWFMGAVIEKWTRDAAV